MFKDLNTLMQDQTLHRGRKQALQAFSSAEIIKSDANYFFKINGKKMIKIPQKS